MNEEIYSLTFELKELLASDERVLLLNSLEKKLNENEEVMALAYQKDVAASKYSDALSHFVEDSEEVKAAQKELFDKKTTLDNHPLVREYLSAYSKVRDLYLMINETLFSNLSLNMKGCKICE